PPGVVGPVGGAGRPVVCSAGRPARVEPPRRPALPDDRLTPTPPPERGRTVHDIKTTSEEPGSTTADGADAAERGVLAADPVALSYSGDGELGVLLVQRRWEAGQGVWALPGGHPGAGENGRGGGGGE